MTDGYDMFWFYKLQSKQLKLALFVDSGSIDWHRNNCHVDLFLPKFATSVSLSCFVLSFGVLANTPGGVKRSVH